MHASIEILFLQNYFGYKIIIIIVAILKSFSKNHVYFFIRFL